VARPSDWVAVSFSSAVTPTRGRRGGGPTITRPRHFSFLCPRRPLQWTGPALTPSSSQFHGTPGRLVFGSVHSCGLPCRSGRGKRLCGRGALAVQRRSRHRGRRMRRGGRGLSGRRGRRELARIEGELSSIERLNDGYRRIRKELPRLSSARSACSERAAHRDVRPGALLAGRPPPCRPGQDAHDPHAGRLPVAQLNRIQFTPDLMPSDITGTEVLQEDKATGQRISNFSTARCSRM